MRIFDGHVHTNFSFDSTEPMENVVKTAKEKGLAGVTITDHYNPDCPVEAYRAVLDPPEVYYETMERIRSEQDGSFQLLRGLEINVLPELNKERCSNVVRTHDFDCIIVGIHSSADQMFCYDSESEEEAVSEFRKYYSYILKCVTEYKDFDTLAHLNFFDRFVSFRPDHSLFDGITDEIFRTLIRDGKALEVNTSKQDNKEVTDKMRYFLRRYLDLGGTMVTVGSDAHRADRLAQHFPDAFQMIREAGLDHYTVFIERKPVSVSID